MTTTKQTSLATSLIQVVTDFTKDVGMSTRSCSISKNNHHISVVTRSYASSTPSDKPVGPAVLRKTCHLCTSSQSLAIKNSTPCTAYGQSILHTNAILEQNQALKCKTLGGVDNINRSKTRWWVMVVIKIYLIMRVRAHTTRVARQRQHWVYTRLGAVFEKLAYRNIWRESLYRLLVLNENVLAVLTRYVPLARDI